MVIVAIGDEEWWIGETVEACVAAASDVHSLPIDDDLYQDAYALDDAALDRLKFIDTDDDGRQVGVEARTFREELANQVAAGGEFPRMFACSEY